MQETVLYELDVSRKKVFFVAVYRNPSQKSEQFENFIDNLQILVNRLQMERPHLLIITGDFNCRTSLWRTNDAKSPEGVTLDKIIEGNNLYQLFDEPTTICVTIISCVDVIITDQPNLFVESGVRPSLDDNCQHQIIYGKLIVSLSHSPPYKRTVWEYEKANTLSVRAAL